MTVTLKQVEKAIEKYDGLGLFLAGCRSTMHELASIGKTHYERADKAESMLEKFKAVLSDYECECDEWPTQIDGSSPCLYCNLIDIIDDAELTAIAVELAKMETDNGTDG